MIRISIIDTENNTLFFQVVEEVTHLILVSFVLDNAEYFDLRMKEDGDDVVRLIASKSEEGEFTVRVGYKESEMRLVVCPVGKVLAKVNPKSKEIVDMDEDEFLQQPF